MEPETQSIEPKPAHPVFKVTTLSKYLALILFIFLPFLGGYVGYVYAPEKVVEVERVIAQHENRDESTIDYSQVLKDIIDNDLSLEWIIVRATSSIYINDQNSIANVSGIKLTATEMPKSDAFTFTSDLSDLWMKRYEMIVNADGLPARDLDVYKIGNHYVSVEMEIIFRERLEDEYVELGSVQEAFGIADSVRYEIFISEPIE